ATINCVGISVVPPPWGAEPTRVNGKVLPSKAKDPEKWGTLEMACRCKAISASAEILLAASKRGCAPWLCRNPTSWSAGRWEASAASDWLTAPTGRNKLMPAQHSRAKPSRPRNKNERNNSIPQRPDDILFQAKAFVDLFRASQ